LRKKPVSHFFVSSRGTRLDGGDVRRTFYQLSRQIGLRDVSVSHGPRLPEIRGMYATMSENELSDSVFAVLLF
jgi:hypothetical protein